MEFAVVSIREYSRILLTTRRSEPHFAKDLTVTHKYHRVIIASIRNLGHCPCPRCLIPLDRVDHMGMPRDMAQRITLARVDDLSRRNRVATARENIYEKGYAVNSNAVEKLLQAESLVPTAVRIPSYQCWLSWLIWHSPIPECIF